MNYRWDQIASKYIELMTQIQSAKRLAAAGSLLDGAAAPARRTSA
jgi:hypothetical protein